MTAIGPLHFPADISTVGETLQTVLNGMKIETQFSRRYYDFNTIGHSEDMVNLITRMLRFWGYKITPRGDDVVMISW